MLIHPSVKTEVMENKIVFLFIYIIIAFKLTAQNTSCNDYKVYEETKLYTYNCDPNKSLVYKFLMCKHSGKHKSVIEILKSDEYDTTEIKGKLKIDIGYFEDSRKSKEDISSFNYQNGDVTYTTYKDEISDKTINFMWEKWYAIMKFNCYVTTEPKLTFEGKCNEMIQGNMNWSNWISLWENKQDSISVMYRTKSYMDEKSNKHKTDIEIQGPKNYINGEVFIRGNISKGNQEDINVIYFILNETGKSVIKTIEDKNFDSHKIILTQKKYNKNKTPKVKTKSVVSGVRG